jgi:predicted lipoprotein with Yx(FWY)xxD motif
VTRALVLIVSLVIAVALVGAASGDDWVPAPTATADTPRPTRVGDPETKLKLKRSPYGRVLFADGYAMYLFTRDEGSESKCRGRCAKAWPPLRPRGELTAGRGVKRQLLGTITRANGTEQVTYDGHPLYGYVDDPRGEVLCHEVEEFGGTWLAVRRSGRPAP